MTLGGRAEGVRAALDRGFGAAQSALWRERRTFDEHVRAAVRQALGEDLASDAAFNAAWARFRDQPLMRAELFIEELAEALFPD